MTVVPLRPKPRASAYMDVLGCRWDAEKLDRVLADPDVHARVSAIAHMAAQPDGTWYPANVLAVARNRYPREAAAALLLLLVTRYLDTEGAHLLGRERVG